MHDNEEGLVITLKLVPNPEFTQLYIKLLCRCKSAEAGKPAGKDSGDDGEGVEDE